MRSDSSRALCKWSKASRNPARRSRAPAGSGWFESFMFTMPALYNPTVRSATKSLKTRLFGRLFGRFFGRNLQIAPFSAFLEQDEANLWAVTFYWKSAGRVGRRSLGIRRGESRLRRAAGVGACPCAVPLAERGPARRAAPGQARLRQVPADRVPPRPRALGRGRPAVPRRIFSSGLHLPRAGTCQ